MHMESFISRRRTLHFPLWKFMKFLLVHFPSFFRSLWMAAGTFNLSTTSSFVAFANLMKVRAVPPAKSLMKMTDSIDSSTDSWGQSAGLHAADWPLAVWLTFSPLLCPFTYFTYPVHIMYIWECQRNLVKSLAKIKSNSINPFSFIHWGSHFTVEGFQIVQQDFPFVTLWWRIPDTLSSICLEIVQDTLLDHLSRVQVEAEVFLIPPLSFLEDRN